MAKTNNHSFSVYLQTTTRNNTTVTKPNNWPTATTFFCEVILSSWARSS